MEQAEEEKASAQRGAERTGQLEALLTSAGYNTLKLGPIDWSTEDAARLLREEEQEQAKLDGVMGRLRDARQNVQKMIAGQMELQQRIDAVAMMNAPVGVAMMCAS